MEEIRQLLITIRTAFDNSGAKKADTELSQLTKKLKTAAKALGVIASVGALAAFANKTLKAAGAIKEAADGLGLTTDEFQRLQFAAEATGVKTSEFRVGMTRFTVRMAQAAKGIGTAKDAFRQLGIPLKDNEGNLRRLPAVLDDVADGLKGVENESERLRLAAQLFSAEDAALVATFSQGSEELRKLKARFDQLGGGFTAEMIAGSEHATRAFLELRVMLRGLVSTIFVFLLPKFNSLLHTIIEITNTIRGNERFMLLLKAAVIGLGAALLVLAVQWVIGFAPALLMGALVIAILIAIGLAIDEVWTLFQGGETIIGELIDHFFGVGAAVDAATAALQFFKDTWAIVVEFFTGTIGDLGGMWDTFVDKIIGARSVFSSLPGARGLEGNAPGGRGLQAAAAPVGPPVQQRGLGGTTINRAGDTINVNGVSDPKAAVNIMEQKAARRRAAELKETRASVSRRAGAT